MDINNMMMNRVCTILPLSYVWLCKIYSPRSQNSHVPADIQPLLG